MNASESPLPTGWYGRFHFVKGVAAWSQLPPDGGSEVAFAGRSNAGKSTVINILTNQRSLARTAKAPGRTRELNYFDYTAGVSIVDLPGYGYARVSDAQRRAWDTLLSRYLQQRQALRGIFLIMDIRHPLRPADQWILNHCATCRLPVHILLNKADKLSGSAARTVLNRITTQLADSKTVSLQLFSKVAAVGVDEARQRLADWLFCQPLRPGNGGESSPGR